MMNHTWVDGFGLYHALVADTPKARREAKQLIKADQSARGESPHYDLRVDRIPAPKGIHGYIQFVER